MLGATKMAELCIELERDTSDRRDLHSALVSEYSNAAAEIGRTLEIR